jgi:hypothetical protein
MMGAVVHGIAHGVGVTAGDGLVAAGPRAAIAAIEADGGAGAFDTARRPTSTATATPHHTAHRTKSDLRDIAFS